MLEFLYPLRKYTREKLILPMRKRKYVAYSSNDFKKRLQEIGILSGDSIFVMCSPDKVYRATGHKLPVHLVINELLEVIGEEGTIMALGYSQNRDQIFDGNQIFNVKKLLPSVACFQIF